MQNERKQKSRREHIHPRGHSRSADTEDQMWLLSVGQNLKEAAESPPHECNFTTLQLYLSHALEQTGTNQQDVQRENQSKIQDQAFGPYIMDF